MNDATLFIETYFKVRRQEKKLKKLKKALSAGYEIMVNTCPHADAVTTKSLYTGSGSWVVCTMCGLEDRARIGGTPGDEYDYGYPGHYDRQFWLNSNIEHVSEKVFNNYRRNHYWQVIDGKPTKG